jgi:uncharacterized protein YqjF (DUF2071 family)
MQQTWHDLLFAHWPVAAAALRPLIPTQLTLDTFAGQCWVGVIPFHMSDIRRRGIPPLPGLSHFPELNVRTYVNYGDKRGVYFFSLDAANRAAVWAARTFYHLPYFHADMATQEREGFIHYSSRRYRASAEFRGTYRSTSEVSVSSKDSIEHWLTERYCLYTEHRGKLYRGDIHHRPWPLEKAEAEFEINTMAEAACLPLPKANPHLVLARKLEVLIWPLVRAEAAAGIISRSEVETSSSSRKVSQENSCPFQGGWRLSPAHRKALDAPAR